MIGHNVEVIRTGELENVSGILQKSDQTGVVVHKCYGFDDDKVFLPIWSIVEIHDKGWPAL